MPPTAAIAFAVTAELPPALAELDEGEFEYRMQVGAFTVVLPLFVMPVALALLSSASMHALPPATMLPAVAGAVMGGAVLRKNELNDSGC